MNIRFPDYSLFGADSKRAYESELVDASWYQCHVDKQDMLRLLERKNGPATRDTLLWFGLLIGSGVAGFSLWGTWWAIFPFFIYGVLYGTACDSRWHESLHGTAFKSDWMNRVLYEIASFMVVRESVYWRWTHIRHHSDTLITGRDPEIAAQRPPRIWVHLANMFNLKVWGSYIKKVSTHFLGKVSKEDRDLLPESEFKKLILGARLIVIIYFIVIGLSIWLDSILPLLYVGLPSIYGAWLMPVYSLTQHSGLNENVLDHRINCRTIYMNRIHRFIYWNMNYHMEHHMFPLVPYHALPHLHELIRNDCPEPHDNLFSAWREILPAWKKQKKDPSYFIHIKLPDSNNSVQEKSDKTIEGDQNKIEKGWIAICKTSDFLPSDIKRFDYDSRTYSVYKTMKGDYHATDGFCTHGNSHLSDGMLIGNVIECSKHNGRFNLEDGSPRRSPVCIGLNTYKVKEEKDQLWLSLESIQSIEEKQKNETTAFIVVSNLNLTTDIKELVLEPLDTSFNFKSGEYVQLQIPIYNLTFSTIKVDESFKTKWEEQNYFTQFAQNHEITTRNYSIATNPYKSNLLKFNVRMQFSPSASEVSAGIGSSYVFGLQPGDMVKAYGPFGDFHVRNHSEKEMVYIGGGAGMAPLRSHISYLLETKKTKSKLSYWYGARTKYDLFYAEYFNTLSIKNENFDFHVALSDISAEDSAPFLTGYIHDVFEKKYLSSHKSVEDIDFYLCGPPAMIEACKKMLNKYGVNEKQVMYDEF